MKFDAGRARSFAALLTGPRACGTEAERTAAGRIREAFRDAGLGTREEHFTFRPAGDLAVRTMLLLALAGLGALYAGPFFHPGLAVAGAGLLAALAAGAKVLPRAILMASVATCGETTAAPAGRLKSSNVIGEAPGPAAGPMLVFLAHYDSKSQNMPIALRALLFSVLTPAALALAGLSLAAVAGFELPAAALHAAAAVSLAAALPLLALRTGNDSPGALDNACGVGVLVELARQWRAHPASRLARARFVATSAEEHGLIGARVHVAAGGEALRREARCWVLNLDGCATPGALKVLPARGVACDGKSVPGAFAAGAASAGVAIGPLRAIGILADHVPFVEAGLPCASLLGFGPGTWRIHTSGDDASLLEDGPFAVAGGTVLGAVEYLLGDERG